MRGLEGKGCGKGQARHQGIRGMDMGKGWA